MADDVPGWTVTVEEISAGVYRFDGHDLGGRSVSLTGEDPEKLLQDVHERLAKNADSLPTGPGQTK